MRRNGERPEATRATKEGNGRMAPPRRDDRKKKEQRLIEAATELVIEMYGPALKELEKH